MASSVGGHGKRESELHKAGVTRREVLALAAFGLVAAAPVCRAPLARKAS